MEKRLHQKALQNGHSRRCVSFTDSASFRPSLMSAKTWKMILLTKYYNQTEGPSRVHSNQLTPNYKNCWCNKSKEQGFFKDIAQNAVQLESALSNHAKVWYFMECSYNEGKPSFKLSEPVTVVCKDEDLQAKVEKVLRRLLEEAQKLDTVLDIGKEREIKRVRSIGNLARKSN
ncbi:hypothetical protein RhiirA4_462782 [Rhizophagus irregularis]|uniref:Uncharacterized protein n=1 Tax=Rhizophagus irregularis TaxID=588596 RepID=A0A2I1GLX3_9GLOM|nr:hypothetical protein RhiirA4_462782 [Rhizophagus irregularis]